MLESLTKSGQRLDTLHVIRLAWHVDIAQILLALSDVNIVHNSDKSNEGCDFYVDR